MGGCTNSRLEAKLAVLEAQAASDRRLNAAIISHLNDKKLDSTLCYEDSLVRAKKMKLLHEPLPGQEEGAKKALASEEAYAKAKNQASANAEKIFAKLDADKNGDCDLKELEKAFRADYHLAEMFEGGKFQVAAEDAKKEAEAGNIPVPPNLDDSVVKMDTFFKFLDKNGDGKVSKDEFIQAFSAFYKKKNEVDLKAFAEAEAAREKNKEATVKARAENLAKQKAAA